jgi:hypothetical protein
VKVDGQQRLAAAGQRFSGYGQIPNSRAGSAQAQVDFA